MSEMDNKARDASRLRRAGLAFKNFFLPTTKPEEENIMASKHESKGQTKGPVNQHKRMAEGEKITGMKSGGKVVKKAEGGCMKKGGKAKGKK